MEQASLLCGCGGHLDCPQCDRRARLNREDFDGLREFVLRRDDCQCQACGEVAAELLLVHHRRPGRNVLHLLVTLCRRCHVRVHFTYRPGYGFAQMRTLYALWRELHRREPEQLLLTDASRPEQVSLLSELVA